MQQPRVVRPLLFVLLSVLVAPPLGGMLGITLMFSPLALLVGPAVGIGVARGDFQFDLGAALLGIAVPGAIAGWFIGWLPALVTSFAVIVAQRFKLRISIWHGVASATVLAVVWGAFFFGEHLGRSWGIVALIAISAAAASLIWLWLALWLGLAEVAPKDA